jgi:hypothetical protein
MTNTCPNCQNHIGENSACMIKSGLVYHLNCAPAGRPMVSAPAPKPAPGIIAGLLALIGLR